MVLLSGCSSVAGNCRSAGTVNQALCRQDGLQTSTAGHVTVGLLVGAALGAGFATALSGDPLAGALAGAMIGGSVAYAASEYLDYVRRKSGPTETMVAAAVAADITKDAERAETVIEDSDVAIVELRDVMRTDGDLVRRHQRLGAVSDLRESLSVNVRCFRRTSEIYDQCFDVTQVGNIPGASAALAILKVKTSLAEQQERQYAEIFRNS